MIIYNYYNCIAQKGINLKVINKLKLMLLTSSLKRVKFTNLMKGKYDFKFKKDSFNLVII